MSFKLIYAAEVYNDLQENVDWYNQIQTSLGSRFFKAVKEQTSRIKKNPYGVAIRYDDVRCAKVKGFPFMVHFKVFPDINIVKVTAVFHTHRDPEIWKNRANK
jgi:FKBP-type peptidyl-prolyl cis-trans isomerase (trigger factor)